jgi:protein CWC15
VFRNQSDETNKQSKRFINDTLRSDFHRRFMGRYIK